MTQKESRLSRNIMQALRQQYGRDAWCYKVHGGPLTPVGIPDIVGVVHGRLIALETKIPDHGNKPSDIQLYIMGRIKRAGGIVGVPRSVADALRIVREGLTQGVQPRRVRDDLSAPPKSPHTP